MYTILIFPGGRRADSVLLSAEEDRMRFAVAGRTDAVELRKVGGRWMGENGSPVELGAFIALGAAAKPRPRTLTAGQPS
jgi:hypothetical protein